VSSRQTYESNLFNGTSNKTLVMVKAADGRWQIREERGG
jgi:hypothetical protein